MLVIASYYRAFELIDLTAPSSVVMPAAEETWTAVEDLVDRFGAQVDGIEFEELKDEIITWQRKGDLLGGTEKASIRQNLLKYFHDLKEKDDARRIELEEKAAAAWQKPKEERERDEVRRKPLILHKLWDL